VATEQGQSNPLIITMTGHSQVFAQFAQIDDLTLLAGVELGEGSVVVDPLQETYTYGTEVSLTAEPATGYRFVGWTGDVPAELGQANPLIITMTGHSQVFAQFALIDDLMVLASVELGEGSVVVDPLQETYTYGTEVSLTAEPATGYRFIGWTGDVSTEQGQSNPLIITMTGHSQVFAQFALIDDLTLLAGFELGEGSVVVDPLQETYTYGTEVSLTAEPATGYRFVAWTGDVAAEQGQANPLIVIVTGDTEVFAEFALIDDLMVLASVELGEGSVMVDPLQSAYTYGSEVSLTAEPATGYRFIGWTGDVSTEQGQSNPLVVTVTGDTQVFAQFALIDDLTLLAGVELGEGSVVVDPLQETYTYGSLVSLTAEPATGYRFVGWTGDVPAELGQANPLIITMTGHSQLFAQFALIDDLTLLAGVELGEGSVVVDPLQETYTYGTEVSLTAEPATGYRFVAWTGDVAAELGQANPLIITMTGHSQVFAQFALIDDLTLLAGVELGEGSVVVDPLQETYTYGTEVSLTAEPATGYRFVAWTGDVAAEQGQANPLIITMTGHSQLFAQFALIDDLTLLAGVELGEGSVVIDPLQETYTYGSEVSLTAEPATGYRFVAWTGDVASEQGQANPLIITMTGHSQLFAQFALIDDLTLLAGVELGEGSVVVDPLQETYTYGSEVSLTAEPATGYRFVAWTGDVASEQGQANPLFITMTGHSQLLAQFALIDDLTLLAGVELGEGSVVVDPLQETYTYGSEVSLTAEPATGYRFVAWTGDVSTEQGQANPLIITMTGHSQLFAQFALIDDLTLLAGVELGQGSVVVDPLQETYTYGSEVSLTAEPATGYRFVAWTGDVSTEQGQANPLIITMTGHSQVFAQFALIDDLTLLAGVELGQGSVVVDPLQETYTYGSEVSLTAESTTGYRFVAWTGDVSTEQGQANPLIITMTGHSQVFAQFALIDDLTLLAGVELGQGSVVVDPLQETYTYGSEVSLTAEPATGYRFVGWTGDVPAELGQANPLIITMTGHSQLFAQFALIDDLTLLAGVELGEGSVVVDPLQETYTYGSEVSLTAEPATGYRFVAWTGDVASEQGQANPLFITMTGHSQLLAQFALIDDLTLLAGVELGEGSVVVDPLQETYTYGTEVSLTAEPATGYRFVGWTGDVPAELGQANPLIITMTGHSQVFAQFALIDDLMVLASVELGEGSVVVDPLQSAYTYGSEVSLTAEPATGYRFIGWTGDVASELGQANPLIITMTGHSQLFAQFALIDDLTLLAGVELGEGSVVVDPLQETYTYGTEVSLTAEPATGYRFVAWTGDVASEQGQANPLFITMTGHSQVFAQFALIDDLTLLAGVELGEGSVVVDPLQETYTYGSEVSLTAEPATGYRFVAWTGDVAAEQGQANPLIITMTGHSQVFAQFALIDDLTLLAGVELGEGSVVVDPLQETYTYGSEVSLTAEPATGYRFVAWTGDVAAEQGQANPLIITMTGHSQVFAQFALIDDLMVLASVELGEGSVMVDPLQSAYTYGSEVSLTAEPATGYRFIGWTGDVSTEQGQSNPLIITMTGHSQVFAQFALIDDLTLLAGFELGEGSVVVDPLQETYTYGTEVSLTAEPATGYRFVAWTGDVAAEQGQANPLIVIVTGDTEVFAEFALIDDLMVLASIELGEGSVMVDPLQSAYTYGSEVSLTAEPATGYRFIGWTGDVSTEQGQSNPLVVTVTGDTQVFAQFALIDDLTLLAGVELGEGSVVVDPLQETYTYGSEVSLTAEPATGYRFVGWTGDVPAELGQSNPLIITMTGHSQLFAQFALIDDLTLLAGVELGEGSVVVDPLQETYTYGSLVSLTAEPATGYRFVGWTGDVPAELGQANPLIITMTGHSQLFAQFALIDDLTLLAGVELGEGSVVVDPLQETYTYGSLVSLTAEPATGYRFVAWTGDVSTEQGQSNPLIITMTGHSQVFAQFALIDDLTLLAGVELGEGSVVVDPLQETYTYGTEVSLTAEPATGYRFVAWTGDVAAELGQANPLIITMTGHSQVFAQFALIDDLTLLAGVELGEGSVVVDPLQETYTYGTEVSLTAEPATGYRFIGWTGDVSTEQGQSNPLIITMTGHSQVFAQFALIDDLTLLAGFELGEGSVVVDPLQETYTYGTEVSLTAEPATGYRFVAWTGDVAAEQGQANPLIITMTGHSQLFAQFALIDDLTLLAGVELGEGSVVVDPLQEMYTYGTEVSLTAEPATGYRFVAWTGDVSTEQGQSNPLIITMTEHSQVFAQFALIDDLTLLTGVELGEGSVMIDPLQETYTYGSEVSLTAEPATGYRFIGWTGDVASELGQSNPLIITMTGHSQVFAQFALIDDLTLLAGVELGEGSVVVDPLQETYTYGSEVSLTAEPATGYRFVAWTGDVAAELGQANPLIITMTGHSQVFAQFALIDDLTLLAGVELGEGSVVVDPLQETYTYGTEVSLTAEPATGYRFVGWTGDVSTEQGQSNPLIITMTGHSQVFAQFALIDDLTLLAGFELGEGSVVVDPLQETYTYGTEVSLTAEPATGYRFVAWTGDVAAEQGQANPLIITMTGHSQLFAQFALIDDLTLLAGVELGEGSVVVDPLQEMYTYGTEVSLTAEPATGYRFVAWTGDVSTEQGQSNPLIITMTEHSQVFAQFALIDDLTLLTGVELGEGSVMIDPLQETYTYGSEVSLTAEPATGYRFIGWTGDVASELGQANPLFITMKGHSQVFAQFALIDDLTLLAGVELGEGSVVVDPLQETYTYGSEVSLTAEPATGYRFVAWTGDVSTEQGQANPLIITMTGHSQLFAQFALIDDLTLLAGVELGEGSVVVDPLQETYTYGSEVSLTAEPATGYRFVAWTGDVSTEQGQANPLIITMTGHSQVFAQFALIDDLTLLAGVELGEGSVVVDPLQETYTYGTEVSLTAEPTTGYRFVAWTGDVASEQGQANPLIITMTGPNQVFAQFALIDDLTLLAGFELGEGSVVVDPLQEMYTYGTEVSLTAEPATGYRFVGWTGDVPAELGQANPLIITMTGPNQVFAQFALIDDLMVLAAVEGGEGSVMVDPLQTAYTYGSDVTLTAEPGVGYRFIGWTGNVPSELGQTNPLIVTVTGDTQVFAQFALIDDLTLLAGVELGEGSVMIDPLQETYTYGSLVSLTAEPATGYRFVAWTGDVASEQGQANPLVVTVTGDSQVFAQFALIDDLTLLAGVELGEGSVVVDPLQETYTYGTEVSLTAEPATGYRFVAWTGDVSTELGQANPLIITMTDHVELFANFEVVDTIELDSRYLLVAANGGLVTLTVTAQPPVNWTFGGTAPWLTLDDSASGQGTGTITLEIDPNPTVYVREVEFTVNQVRGHLKQMGQTVGGERWQTTLPGSISAPLAYLAKVVYAATDRGAVTALNATSGATIWQTPETNETSSGLVVTPTGHVITTTNQGQIRAYAVTTGQLVWQVAAVGGVFAPPAFDSTTDTLYVATARGVLHALSTGTGSEKWRQTIQLQPGAAFPLGNGLFISPLLAGATLHLVTNDNRWLALNAETGAVLSTHAIAATITTLDGGPDGSVRATDSTGVQHLLTAGGPVAHHLPSDAAVAVALSDYDRVLFADNEGAIYSRASATGEPLWVLFANHSWTRGALLGSDRVLYATDYAGLVLAVGAIGGDPVWQQTLAGVATADSILTDDGLLVIGTDRGSIHALRTSSGGLAATAWPRTNGSQTNDRRVATPGASPDPRLTFFQNGELLAGGYMQVPGLGIVYAELFPWLWSETSGWVMSAGANQFNAVYWHPEYGWMRTHPNYYPYVYLIDSRQWVWFGDE
jgi:outer membrane protein assembly factor BamB